MASEHGDSSTPTSTPPGRQASRRGLLHGLGGALLILTATAKGTYRGAGATTHQGMGRKRRAGKRKDRRQRCGEQCTCDATATSGITGQVLIGPMCPVMREDEPCPDQPFAITLRIRDGTGHEVCTTHSGEDGHFRVGLAPGRYELVPITDHPGSLPSAASQTVIVESNQYTDVTVNVDSGIR